MMLSLLVGLGCCLTACSGMNDNMTEEEFKTYVEKHPKDSLKYGDGIEMYYKIANEGSGSSQLFMQYFVYNSVVSTLGGKEISRADSVTAEVNMEPFKTMGKADDKFRGFVIYGSKKGQVKEFYIPNKRAKEMGLIGDDVTYPMVKWSFKVVDIIDELPVKFLGSDLKLDYDMTLYQLLVDYCSPIITKAHKTLDESGMIIDDKGQYVKVTIPDESRGNNVEAAFVMQPGSTGADRVYAKVSSIMICDKDGNVVAP